MKPGSSEKYGIGWIIADCFLIVDAIVNVYTGRITGTELCAIIVLCIIFGGLLSAFMRKNKRKERDQYKSTRTEEQESADNTEE